MSNVCGKGYRVLVRWVKKDKCGYETEKLHTVKPFLYLNPRCNLQALRYPLPHFVSSSRTIALIRVPALLVWSPHWRSPALPWFIGDIPSVLGILCAGCCPLDVSSWKTVVISPDISSLKSFFVSSLGISSFEDLGVAWSLCARRCGLHSSFL